MRARLSGKHTNHALNVLRWYTGAGHEEVHQTDGGILLRLLLAPQPSRLRDRLRDRLRLLRLQHLGREGRVQGYATQLVAGDGSRTTSVSATKAEGSMGGQPMGRERARGV